MRVASLAEAWIETFCHHPLTEIGRSPPSRRRGLKLRFCDALSRRSESPPSRRRGLKHVEPQFFYNLFMVASLAEAWIETGPMLWVERTPKVASLAEAWIETTRSSP